MKVEVERLPNCQVELVIEPDKKAVQDALRSLARKISRQYSIPGYRRGKAPYLAVMRAVGRDTLYQQAADDMSEDLYKKALEETGLEPIAPATLTEVTYDPLVFHFQVPVPPEVDLGDYRSVRVDRPVVEVTEEEIDARLRMMQEEQSEWVPVEDQGAQYGDLVTMRLVATAGDEILVDEDAFELELEEEMETETFPPGFDSTFIGQTPGSTLSFDLTYPDDWPGERAGTEVHFDAEILSIKHHDVPALDDDFALLVGDYDSLEELKESIREEIVSTRRAETDNKYVNNVLTKIIEGAPTITYPDVLVEQAIDRLVDEQERKMGQSSIPLQEYLRITGQSMEDLREQLRRPAEVRLIGDLVLQELGELEGIKATDEQVDEHIERLLRDSGAAGAGLQAMLASEAGRAAAAQDLERTMILERVIAIGEGTAPELPEPEEVAAEDAQEELETGDEPSRLSAEEEGDADGEPAEAVEAGAAQVLEPEATD